ncbi:hypothetical protein C8R44DRAFT_875638 [Mycena epipterygia]|nr:hypothetical protein C8R44DRAFT_875638 [Mycena epipterygia]
MPPAHLAQELLDFIVDQVQERGALKTCSLAARSLVVSSQQRLFRSLCLFAGRLLIHRTLLNGLDHLAVVTSFERALDLFTTSPHLKSYAKDVYLGLIDFQDFGVVESVLHMASQITVLGIFGNTTAIKGLHWGSIPASFAALLKEIALRPTVRSMSMRWITNIPSSLSQDMTSTSPFIPLLLHATHSSNLEMDISGHLTGFRKLSVRSILDKDPEGWMPFLLESNFQHTLKHLELSFIHCTFVFELPLFPALTSLELEFFIDYLLPDALDSALRNLRTIPPLLEYLLVAIKLLTTRRTWPKNCEPYPLFASLDFVKRFPGLREIHCSLGKDCVDAGFEHINDKFSGPKEAGILTCSTI